MMKQLVVLFLVIGALTGFTTETACAQGERKAVIFTGIVVGADNERLPNAYISIPRAGKGTMADSKGYFAIPVFPGDSIVFTYVGYKKQFHRIPANYNLESYSAIIGMREDVQMLSEVRVYPYSSEEEFKRAFLEMRLPDQADREAIAKATDPEYINRMAAMVPNNAQTNYRYMIDQQLFGRESAGNRGFSTTMPFLNPFAWAKFIKGIQNGDLKKKEWRKELNQAPRENLTRQDLIAPEEKFKKNTDN